MRAGWSPLFLGLDRPPSWFGEKRRRNGKVRLHLQRSDRLLPMQNLASRLAPYSRQASSTSGREEHRCAEEDCSGAEGAMGEGEGDEGIGLVNDFVG